VQISEFARMTVADFAAHVSVLREEINGMDPAGKDADEVGERV